MPAEHGSLYMQANNVYHSGKTASALQRMLLSEHRDSMAWHDGAAFASSKAALQRLESFLGTGRYRLAVGNNQCLPQAQCPCSCSSLPDLYAAGMGIALSGSQQGGWWHI